MNEESTYPLLTGFISTQNIYCCMCNKVVVKRYEYVLAWTLIEYNTNSRYFLCSGECKDVYILTCTVRYTENRIKVYKYGSSY